MARTLSLLSWNVHGFVGGDGRHDLARVLAVIEAENADVVGLQEVDCQRRRGTDAVDPLAFMAERLDLCAIAGATRHGPHGFFGNALLTRLPVASVHHWDVSVPGRERRAILDVHLRADDSHLRVLVTHFGLRAAERRGQCRTLLALLDRHPDTLTIAMGDFNEWHPRSRTIARLDRAMGRVPVPATFPARLPLLHLDRIWVRPARHLQQVRRIDRAPARIASDHLPLVSTVVVSGSTDHPRPPR